MSDTICINMNANVYIYIYICEVCIYPILWCLKNLLSPLTLK